MVERKRAVPTEIPVKKSEFYTAIRDLILERLESDCIEPTEKNIQAFRRRAREHFGKIQRKDLSLTIGSEWHFILDEAAKLTSARILRKGHREE